MGENSGLLRKSWDDGVYISQRSIWVQDDLNIYEKVLWMCLEKYANGKDAAWPSRSTLARECSISIAQVKRTIASLIEKGLLEKTNRRNESYGKKNFITNLYTLFLPNQRSEHMSGRVCQTPGGGANQEVGSDRPHGRVHQNRGVGSDRPQGRVCQTPERNKIELYKKQQQDPDHVEIEPGTSNDVVVSPEIKNGETEEEISSKGDTIAAAGDNFKDVVQSLMKYGVDQNKAEELACSFSAERINQVLYYTSSKKPTNTSGYIISALENGWSIPKAAPPTQAEEKKDLLKEQTREILKNLEEARKNTAPLSVQTEHIGAILSRLRCTAAPG